MHLYGKVCQPCQGLPNLAYVIVSSLVCQLKMAWADSTAEVHQAITKHHRLLEAFWTNTNIN